ncbi:MAG: 50S ribosomal protein L24, partial [Rubrivivax sp.]|nr:50S ribosomal protein L24 [Rubrivivax sp.]
TMSIHQTNISIWNTATSKADRIGIKIDGDKKTRVFKSSGEPINA